MSITSPIDSDKAKPELVEVTRLEPVEIAVRVTTSVEEHVGDDQSILAVVLLLELVLVTEPMDWREIQQKLKR